MKRWINLASAVFLLAGVVFMLIFSLREIETYRKIYSVCFFIGGVLRVIAYVKK